LVGGVTILISGSSGLVGQALVEALRARGDTVRRLVRREDGADDAVRWSPSEGTVAPGALDGVRAVVHLAGESIAGGRWTEERKRRVMDSRVQGTHSLARAIAATDHKPAFVSASAIGYYGDRGDALLTEEDHPGDLFLSEVCVAWEAAAVPAADAGARVVHPRIGVVLSRHGGALATMLPVFRLGAGGVVGSGRQYMSWISLPDLVRLLMALVDEPLSGPVNAVAPDPVTNRQFTRALGRALGRPTFLPLPGFAVKAALGQMGNELLLASTRVSSRRIEQAGFRFEHPSVETALRAVLEDDG
jgi:hypothetical protein